MHIALFAPYSCGPIRGNIVTVHRIAQNLALHGITTSIIPLDTLNTQEINQQLADTPPTLIHAFHAFHAGPIAREIAKKSGAPYIISITGSDLFEPSMRDHPATLKALEEAVATCCFDDLIAIQLRLHFTAIADRISVIPQGVEPLTCHTPAPRPRDAFILLLPAALRPAKGILEAIDALTPLAAVNSRLQLWLVGGELNEDYGNLVRQRIDGESWIKLYGEVPHEQMGAFFASSDAVLNNSFFEGGMANTLLEAMACAKTVIASDIPGNRSLLQHGKTGWLFSDKTELRQMVHTLMQQPDLQKIVGRAAQEFILKNFSPKLEASALLELYRKLLA